MEVNQLKFPAITNKGGIIEFVRSIEDLETCSYPAYKNHYYSGLELIDSEGNKVKISDATAIDSVGVFGFLKKKIKVRLSLIDEGERISLEEFKDMMRNMVSSDNSLWESTDNNDDVLGLINREDSIAKILTELTLQYYKEY